MNLSKKLSFLVCFVLPVIAIVGQIYGGFYHLIVPATVFIALPILDFVFGKDRTNPNESDFLSLQNDSYYRYLTYVWAFFQLGFVIWAVIQVVLIERPIWETLLFAFSVGLVTGGIGITVAHELGHKASKWEQFLSKMVYMTVAYMHFFIEHNRGHHVNVSTFDDPATSRLGENFYQFYPRTFVGSLHSAWKLEVSRLSKSGLKTLHYKNEMLRYAVVMILFCGFLFGISSYIKGSFAYEAVIFFVVQAFVAISLLELTNYIEHYGLRRKEVSPGKFEKVLPGHSWNQNYFVSNAFLFHLQRHSDHHASAGRRYQALRHYDEAPQLPYGYEVMILIALIPPLWFKMMHPILENWETKKVSA
jgi:alkane 1-monooxygenase